jgi:hypothetical protein
MEFLRSIVLLEILGKLKTQFASSEIVPAAFGLVA